MPESRIRLLLTGARDTLPLIFAAIPFGLVFGALAQSNGLSVEATIGMSALVFAGSSQFIAATLIGSAAALPVVLLTVFIVNLRHMLYSASMMPYVRNLPQGLRVIMSFWLTDETFATVSTRLNPETTGKELSWYYIGSAVAMYSNWQICTMLGIFMEQKIPDMTGWGLDIAMVVAFIGIIVPALHQASHWVCAFVAAFSALLTHDWPNQSGLLFSSILAIVVGVLLARKDAVNTHAAQKTEETA